MHGCSTSIYLAQCGTIFFCSLFLNPPLGVRVVLVVSFIFHSACLLRLQKEFFKNNNEFFSLFLTLLRCHLSPRLLLCLPVQLMVVGGWLHRVLRRTGWKLIPADAEAIIDVLQLHEWILRAENPGCLHCGH